MENVKEKVRILRVIPVKIIHTTHVRKEDLYEQNLFIHRHKNLRIMLV